MQTISVEQAVERITAALTPVETWEEVELSRAIGRILAEDIAAIQPQPPFDRSPLDGYALMAADTVGASKDEPVTLRVIDRVMAGSVASETVTAGTAVRIMTGAPIPAGADCVIRQEDTDYGEEQVAIYTPLRKHENYCFCGEDYPAGTSLMDRGEKLDAVDIGILAGAGIAAVKVYRKVRVALITSGDELIAPGMAGRPGKIYNSNHYLLRSRLSELGFDPVMCAHVGDEAEETASRIRAAAREADLIITTGGVSVGQRDVMHEVVSLLGGEQLFWRIAAKPGSPVLAYTFGGKPVIALSGNPFGAFATFELLVRPALAKLSGDRTLEMEKIRATVEGDFPKGTKGRRFVRAKYRHGTVEIPKQGHASGMLSALKHCNCLVDIQGPNGGLHTGDTVEVWLL